MNKHFFAELKLNFNQIVSRSNWIECRIDNENKYF